MHENIENQEIIERFYAAFNNGDYKTMQDLYHPAATFSDPVFRDMNAKETRAMWQMLVTSGKDLKVTVSNVKGDVLGGTCHWEAVYTFSTTGRVVHNKIDARFEIANGKILRHEDNFNLHKWSRMAFGLTGAIAGWTPFFKKKIRETAEKRLAGFMRRNAL